MKLYATCFWQDDATLLNNLTDYGYGKPEWKNIRFTLEDDFDIAVVLTRHNSSCLYPGFKGRPVIRFKTEPPVTCDNFYSSLPYTSSMYLPLSFWFQTPSVADKRTLLNKKTKKLLLSSVASELSWLEGHIKRLQFIYTLDKVIEEGFDLYGRAYSGDYFKLIRSYKYELQDKFEALINYQYHFNCENSFVPDYFTEKILDPIMAECLCFYDGCTNIENYIDERAFIKLNMDNIEDSIEMIIKAIQDNEYRKRLKYIRQQKKRLLYDLNPLNIIWAEVNGKDTNTYFKL